MKIIFLGIALLLSSCAMKSEPAADLFEAKQLYSQGKYQQAVREYERLVKSMPQDAELWFRLANGYVRVGQPDAAVQAYRNVLLRDPEYSMAWHNLAEVHLQMALQAYREGSQYIADDDPVAAVISGKQEKLMQLMEKPAKDGRE
jgi:tetratricopeptide (TPR) repeat protein